MNDDTAPAQIGVLVKIIKDFRVELRVELKLAHIRLERVGRAIDRTAAAVSDLEARLTYVEKRLSQDGRPPPGGAQLTDLDESKGNARSGSDAPIPDYARGLADMAQAIDRAQNAAARPEPSRFRSP